ncbi:hypothetical protein Dimus_023862 [Dionaea muscipula]
MLFLCYRGLVGFGFSSFLPNSYANLGFDNQELTRHAADSGKRMNQRSYHKPNLLPNLARVNNETLGGRAYITIITIQAFEAGHFCNTEPWQSTPGHHLAEAELMLGI